MRFSLHGGSVEEEAVLGEFAERLGARFATYKALDGEEPLLVVECFPRRIGLLEQITRWLDESPPGHGVAGGAQDPLPGLDTPPCR
jgi:hypothetical protein